MKTLALSLLRIDGGTQSRAALNEVAVAEYAEAIRFAVALPPITVYFDGSAYWVADGFHRYHAHRAAGAVEIDADVRDGTRRDAILHSVGANAAHGLRRTNDDKRRAVATLLNDAEWSKWSDNAIAKACGVSHTFVGALRPVTCNVSSEAAEKTYKTKHGTEAVMQTANIGKAKNTPESAVEREPQGGMAAAPSASPVAEPENYGPSDDEVAAALAADAAQLEYIKNLLSAEDDPLTKALAEVKMYRERARVAEEIANGLQNEKNQLIRTIKSLQAKVKKLEQTA